MKANFIIAGVLALLVFGSVGIYKYSQPTPVPVVKSTLEQENLASRTKIAKKSSEDEVQELMEKCYLAGQRDAQNGIVVIYYDLTDGVYAWKDSPWNSRKPAKYKPTKEDNDLLHYTK